MTIRKGSTWGDPGALPIGGLVAASDADAAAALGSTDRAEFGPAPMVGLLGGDLCRTVGGPGDRARLHGPAAMTFPCDAAQVRVDGGPPVWFVAHVVARTRWGRGRWWAAMNAAWLGPWNAATRAHPNDGLLDFVDVRIPLGQRRAVRRRLPLGAHAPHPRITERRGVAADVDLGATMAIAIDGRSVGRGRHLSVEVFPDALQIVI